MIDRLSPAPMVPVFSAGDASGNPAGRKVLRMVTSDRMAGSIPMWEDAKTPEQKIEQDLSQAQNGSANGPDSKNTLTYQPTNASSSKDQEFGFGDLLDIVNPLQHIPIVSHFYRELTGDQIKPMGRLVGGTLFGGPVGLVSNGVNLILEKETGKDLTGNALALLTHGEMPHLKEVASNNASDLPGTLLAFADLKHDPDIQIERKPYWDPPPRPLWGND